RELHRARHCVRASRYALRKAVDAIAIPDGHRREKSVCRRLRRLPRPARKSESSPPAKTSGHARRHGREFSSADRQPSCRSQEDCRPERLELWEKFSLLSPQQNRWIAGALERSYLDEFLEGRYEAVTGC